MEQNFPRKIDTFKIKQFNHKIYRTACNIHSLKEKGIFFGYSFLTRLVARQNSADILRPKMAIICFKRFLEQRKALLTIAFLRRYLRKQIVPGTADRITPDRPPCIVLCALPVLARKAAERTLIERLRVIGIVIAQRQAGNGARVKGLRTIIFPAAKASIPHRLVAFYIPLVPQKCFLEIILESFGASSGFPSSQPSTEGTVYPSTPVSKTTVNGSAPSLR